MKIKKFLPVVLIFSVMAIVCPAFSEAQTKSKSKTTSSRTASVKPFSASTLIQKGTFSNGLESNMEGTLKRMGFSQNGEVYSKDGLTVNMNDPLKLIVTFPSTAERDNFIESSKSLGYKWEGLNCVNGKDLSLDIAVDGNTIEIFFPE